MPEFFLFKIVSDAELSFFSLSSYTGGLNQATARELQEASDAGDKEVHADVDARKCFCVVFLIFLCHFVWEMVVDCPTQL